MKNCLYIVLFIGVCFGQEIEWFVSYNGSGEESMGHFIIQCEDGGFLQVGETYFFSNPVSTKLYVVKTNIDGLKIWDNEIYMSGHNLGNSALESADGYIIFGGLDQNSSIIKLNKDNGAVIYNKSYDNGGTDAFENGVETPNGIVAVGYINSEDPYNSFYTEGEGFISFLDNEANEITSFSIGDYISQAYRIKMFENELYISGLTQEALNYKMIKMSLEGDIIWHYEYGGSGSDHCFAMDMNEQGEIFLAGHTTSNTENWDVYTIKLNNEGEVLWENKIGNPRGFNPLYIHDEAWGVRSTLDGGCVTVAGTGDEYDEYSECDGSICSDIWNAYIIKYDSNGLVTWSETFSPLNIGNENYDWAAEDLALTTDGGAVIAIDNGQFGFLKLNNIQNTVSTNNSDIIAMRLTLAQNYPNPFNPVTTLHYGLPQDCSVNIIIYDMMGSVVRTLVNGSQTAGYKSIQWNATNDRDDPVSAGLYLYTIQAGEYRQTKKMVLLK